MKKRFLKNLLTKEIEDTEDALLERILEDGEYTDVKVECFRIPFNQEIHCYVKLNTED